MSLRRCLLCALLLAVALVGPASARGVTARGITRGITLSKHATARGSGGAVASDTLQATRAGLEVLAQGGTAADAAVAVASTLGVTDPFVAGIGGGGYFVYYDARTHRVYTLDGRETAPAAANANLFIDPATGKPLPFPTAVTSGLSVGVPGNLMTWQRALNRWGHLSLATDLAPAQQVARRGFRVTPTLREQVRENAFRFDQFSSTSALFLPHGGLPVVGSIMRNPALARTYALIARRGIGVFYGGAIGRDVVHTVHNLPLAPGATLIPRLGTMTLADLARYRAPLRAPTHVRYRGYDVYSMAPSSSGGSTVGESLGILSNFDLGTESRVQVLHHYLEATRLAFADRNRYVGDPAYVQVPLAQLLSPGFARQRACLINPAHALTSPLAPGDPFAGSGGCTPQQPASAADAYPETDTNHLVVADRFGDVASYTNTIEQLGGSGVAVPGRGFLLNNELTDFDFAPPSSGLPDPNLPAGGKRPRSSMSPTIVLKRRKPVLALGAAGGATIITTVLQTLINRIDLHMSLPQAVASPRASQRNLATTQAEPAFIAEPTTAGLQQLGQTFAVSDTSPSTRTSRSPPRSGSRTRSSCSPTGGCSPPPSRCAAAVARPASSLQAAVTQCIELIALVEPIEPIELIAACEPPGTTSPGTSCGTATTAIASASSSAAVAQVTERRHGSVFSSAISAAIRTIQVRLITPSANSAAIRAQQHPRHQPACRAPISSAPREPSRQDPSRKPSGLRHRVRQTSLSGVSS